MTRIKNITTLSNEKTDLVFPGLHEQEIDGSHLTVLPALIDPHVHFRVPGAEHKEDWKSGALAAVRSGVTTVLDMPNNNPPCTTLERLHEKKRLIDAQLKAVDIPLRYGLYFGADKEHLDQIALAKAECPALKIFMGCSTGGLVIDTDAALDEAFRIASQAKLLVAVHAEDEAILIETRKKYAGATDPAMHSLIRPKEAAIRATEKALNLSAKYNTPLYILHLSTKEELELVRQAKKNGLPVFAEATTHHLFFTVDDYKEWKTLVQMNPPLRTHEDQEALWEGIADGTFDTIGTDHAPHTLQEKLRPFGEAPSGIPGIETLLPLMLDAVNQGRLTLKRLVELTRTNIEKIFSLPSNTDVVCVDRQLQKTVDERELKSKCGWTPYRGKKLTGWPIYTVCRGRLFYGSGFNPKTVEETQRHENGRSSNWGSSCAKS